jgi:ribosomal-protein-alanine N-acetyltransferase
VPTAELIRLTEALLPAALELDRRCFGGLWSLEGYRRELVSPNSELFVLRETESRQKTLSTVASGLLGLSCYWSILEEAHITILGIDPDHQRQGLGQALLYTVLLSAVNRGLERATLEVRISNQSAIALYQKFGFHEAGRRKRYYQDTGEDALILWRGGLHHPEFVQALDEWRSQAEQRLQASGWQLSSQWNCSPSETLYLT